MKVKVDELKFENINTLSELDLISYYVENNYNELDTQTWRDVILFFRGFGFKPVHKSSSYYNGIIFHETGLFYSPEPEKFFIGVGYRIDNDYFIYCKQILNFKLFKKVEEEKDESESE
jgi:hypothetical protein